MSYLSELGRRLRTAGIEPDDTDDVKLKKSLLMFAMGLTVAAPVLWLALYGAMGLNLPASVPFGYQLVSLGTLLVYLVTRNFDLFRVLQLSLYLFFPFVLQWQLGDFITASGFVLWGLLAPIVAVLVYSPRDSIPWFVAYIVLIVAAAGADYYLFAEGAKPAPVPPKTIVVFFALNFVAISSVVYFLLRYAAVERDKSKARMEEAHRLLQAEQERSERLLLNILPGPVAERLKMEDGTIADGFADVTVMFADIVNFTTLAEGMSPNQIFAMLNKVFSSFDSLAERHGLEKIKTIGDAYMVAGGFPEERDGHVNDVAAMALDMLQAVTKCNSEMEQSVNIRIGIHSGPAVAGVIGIKKFVYDVWGDTVNTASRMESSGLPGRIQLSERAETLLSKDFICEERGTVEVKGKGCMKTFWLLGRRSIEPAAVGQA